MGGGGERAAALGTGVPRMAESAFWLVGQCVCVKDLRSCSTNASMFVSLQLSEFKVSV